MKTKIVKCLDTLEGTFNVPEMDDQGAVTGVQCLWYRFKKGSVQIVPEGLANKLVKLKYAEIADGKEPAQTSYVLIQEAQKERQEEKRKMRAAQAKKR